MSKFAVCSSCGQTYPVSTYHACPGPAYYNPGYGHQHQYTAQVTGTDQYLALIPDMAQRLQDLENMLVDVNAGIDEILSNLANLTGNKEDDEKVCRCSEAGCQGCVPSGDAADSGEPSSSRED